MPSYQGFLIIQARLLYRNSDYRTMAEKMGKKLRLVYEIFFNAQGAGQRDRGPEVRFR